ncbi:MAG: drug/metabolite transporter (DMT)-like permease [Desulforhopalus sp.]
MKRRDTLEKTKVELKSKGGPFVRWPLFKIHLCMLLSAVLVSTSFVVGAAITDALDPTILTLIRFFIAAIIFGPIVHYRYGLHYSFSLLWRCSLISGCMVIFFSAMFLSLRYTSALNTSVIFALVPSISCLYSFFLLRERLKKEQFIALFCGLLGVLWVVFKGDVVLLLTMQWNYGDLIFLVGCLFMGLYAPLVKILHRGESMAVMTFWVLVTGVFWLLCYAGKGVLTVSWGEVPLLVWVGISYLAVFTTIITFFITQYSVLFLGPTRVTAYSYLYPGLVLVLNFFVGNGLPQASVIPGVFIIVVAMFVLMHAKENQ